jgi:ribulose 1,5-bisphosphate carboxylase large subunit-like protein
MPDDQILTRYLIEAPHGIDYALDKLLSLQSSGTHTPVPSETDAIKSRFGVEVVAIHPLEPVTRPSLPAWNYGVPVDENTRYHRAEVELSIPLALTETDLTNLLATVAGGIFGLREVSGLRLLEMTLPPAFGDAQPGPQFSVAGTRDLLGVYDRPIIASIIKPNVGLTPAETAAIVQDLIEAGVDFIKDDEKMTSPVYSPLEARIDAVMRVINDYAESTGKKPMYAFNISSDDPAAMVRKHDAVLAKGGTAVMVSIAQVGISGLKFLRQRCQLPIHGQPNGWPLLTRHPALGMEFGVWQQFYRLAGVDHLHVNGIRNKFWESDESVIRSIKACLTPLFKEADRILPVLIAGMWAGQVPDTYTRTGGTVDWMFNAGGGIQGHPAGTRAGVTSILEAWEAATAGIPLAEHARDHEALRLALARFG